VISVYLPGGYRSGISDFTAPIQLVRQQTTIKVPSLKTSQKSTIAGPLYGENMLTTVFRFSSTIHNDSLINTEGYSDDNVGGYWNENNTKPPGSSAKSFLCPILRDFAVDGQLGDLTNMFRAGRIHIKAIGAQLNNLLLFNIPGTAITIDAVDRSLDDDRNPLGWVSLYDRVQTTLSNICVSSSLGGIVIKDSGVKLSQITLFNVVGVGLLIQADQTEAEISGGWLNDVASPTLVSMPSHQIGCKVKITGQGSGGTVLDLRGSDLNTLSGDGNVFDITWLGNDFTPVIYPDGGTDFNLADGTEIWINGVKQKPNDLLQSDLETKVYNLSSTIIIPRQVSRLAIQPPYLGTSLQKPAGATYR
jgi:hypothetical protein